MRVNADFTRRAVMRYSQTEWVDSPAAGVARKMLDRIGDEVARATTIVRFAPGSAFDAHTHDGGEEYLVLEGTFQDEDGDFPVGAYVRNPPTTSHAPAARDGAVILVKLRQFDPDDRTRVRIDTADADWPAARDGLSTLLLHADSHETVTMERWAPGLRRSIEARGGLELFLVDGALTEAGDGLSRWDWLRLPAGAPLEATAGPEGAEVWLKTGHLREMAP
jgi:hypothetical protein